MSQETNRSSWTVRWHQNLAFELDVVSLAVTLLVNRPSIQDMHL